MSVDDATVNAAMDLFRRLPPELSENSLAGLGEINEDVYEELIENIDVPLQTRVDSSGKTFVLCDYCRDGDAYRSPWTNKYYEEVGDDDDASTVTEHDDGFFPPSHLRKMEQEANVVFDIYRKAYFDSGHSSVYFFETGDDKSNEFGACFVIAKTAESGQSLTEGFWNSTHVFSVKHESGNNYHYSLTTTVMISMDLLGDDLGEVHIGGTYMKQDSKTLKVESSQGSTHLSNMGGMLEKTEINIRNIIESIYIQKSRQVINNMRNASGHRDKQFASIAESLKQRLNDHK